MKRPSIVLLTLIFLTPVFLPQFTLADSPVWKISRDDKHLFLGGTIHLLGQSDYPLPDGFEQAYAKADKVIFETDIQKIKSLEFAQTLLGHAMYPPGTNIQKILNPTVFLALKKHLNSRGVPIESMMNFKIGMVVVSLSTIELQRMGVAGAGVDEFYSHRAIRDKKRMGYLETPSQQVAFIADMGKGMENEVVEHTLRDLKTLPKMLKNLKFSWRRGDIDELTQIAIIPFKRDYPEVYQALLAKRNLNWLGPIESMLRTDEVELVMVGALHLAGNEGILKLLEQRGYQIERL